MVVCDPNIEGSDALQYTWQYNLKSLSIVLVLNVVQAEMNELNTLQIHFASH